MMTTEERLAARREQDRLREERGGKPHLVRINSVYWWPAPPPMSYEQRTFRRCRR